MFGVYLPKRRITITIDGDLVNDVDNYIDGSLIRSRSEAIERILKEHLAESKSAVILAGGNPKNLWITEVKTYRPLVPLLGKTLIEDIIIKLKNAGFINIFVVGTSPLINAIYTVLRRGDDYGVKIEYLEELEVLGTAKTLQLVQNKINSDFLLVPCDTYFDFDISSLVEFHKQYHAIATFAIYSRTSFDSKYKGVVEMQGFRIISHVEKPETPTSHLIKTMIGMLNPEIFDYIPDGNVHYTIEEEVIQQLIIERRCFGYPVAGEWLNIHDSNDLKLLDQIVSLKNTI